MLFSEAHGVSSQAEESEVDAPFQLAWVLTFDIMMSPIYLGYLFSPSCRRTGGNMSQSAGSFLFLFGILTQWRRIPHPSMAYGILQNKGTIAAAAPSSWMHGSCCWTKLAQNMRKQKIGGGAQFITLSFDGRMDGGFPALLPAWNSN